MTGKQYADSCATYLVRNFRALGLRVYPMDGEDARTLLASADAAMYRAKEQRTTW